MISEQPLSSSPPMPDYHNHWGAGLRCSSLQSVTNLMSSPGASKFDIIAIVVPKVTCDLPVHPVSTWTHLNDVALADPHSALQGELISSVFTFSCCHCFARLVARLLGPPGTPVSFEKCLDGYLLVQPISLIQNHSLRQTTHSVIFVSPTLGDRKKM